MPTLRVQPLNVLDSAVWRFGETMPTWRHRKYGITTTFDPFPGYAHDLAVAVATADRLAELCPPIWDVEVFLADREDTGRTNGFSTIHVGSEYVDDEWVPAPPVGLAVFAGKRIPPHPAMTAYLMAHEYGHNVEWMLDYAQRGTVKDLHRGDVLKEYATLRGLPDSSMHAGSGGTWHDAAAEVFACDFRIAVAGVDVGFWPHPGVPRPDDPSIAGPVTAWWADAVARLKSTPSPAQESTA